MESALQIENLVKTFNKFQLSIPEYLYPQASCIALLGHNGAGKSTLFELMTGNLDADQGVVRLAGRIIAPSKPEVKKKLGYLPQHNPLPPWASAREILSYAYALYELPSSMIEDHMKFWDCWDYADKALSLCSYGMHKRVGLALATLHDPDFLFLDEPFSGLDLLHLKNLKEMIKSRSQRGKFTLLSSHIISFVAELCHSVLILSHGHMTELSPWCELGFEDKISTVERTLLSL